MSSNGKTQNSTTSTKEIQNNKQSKTNHRKRQQICKRIFYPPTSWAFSRKNDHESQSSNSYLNTNCNPSCNKSSSNHKSNENRDQSTSKDKSNEPNPFSKHLDDRERELQTICRKYGIAFEYPKEDETKAQTRTRHRRLNARIMKQKQNASLSDSEIPECLPPSGNPVFDRALDCRQSFEQEQMS